MTFRSRSFLVFLSLFTVEVLIARYVTQPFIRYWLGDFLVVILIYYFLKSFIAVKPLSLAFFVWIFACTVECIQATDLIRLLGWEHNKVANLILGNTFSFSDLVAYSLGILTVLILEKYLK